MPLSQSDLSRLEDARQVGGTPSVSLTDGEMVGLLRVVASDLDLPVPEQLECEDCRETVEADFFDIPITDFDCAKVGSTFSADTLLERTLGGYTDDDPDVFTYYSLLVQLHSYRRKFERVCATQELPELETVLPRGLLEFGPFDGASLVSWLTWRKYLYDIDNRAAQTTGYLFEPILTEAIGGSSFSSSQSPIERTNREGSRQVDCIVGNTAYEFKMRVTAAASGQGRFREERQFAEDAEESGYTPVLLVLDPTPSKKLATLSGEFRKHGGRAYVGEDAWDHLEERAGETVSTFLERYIRTPLAEVDDAAADIERLGVERAADGTVTVVVGDREVQLGVD